MKWYHKYLLHTVLDKKGDDSPTFVWPGLKESVYREVTYYDTCQHKKRSMVKYGKLPAKLSEETQWNKLCVDIIGPYKILRKGKDPLILKSVTMIYPVTGCFEVT